MEVWASEGWGRSFEDGFQWDVGDGKGISFWEDSWLSCGALKVVFPRLFSLSLAKDAKVAELGNWIDGVWVWHFVWRRSFFEWEKPLEEQLVQLLQGAKLELGKEDCWIWKAGGFKTFTVNSAYVQVRKDTVGEVPPVYSKLWRCKALPSALFTTWRVIENKVATRVNLERCGVVIENPLCCLCGMVEESFSHLFSVCDFAWRVWYICFKWLGVSFVIHKDPLANFLQFRLSQTSDSVNDVWGAIWVGVVSGSVVKIAI
ncbi:uncharacterized protein [Phaseolus vulgaris]|uniref:uncharacterized protein n=1 Tax=Phaseolus vulgaris TaxID=3885 RepID=UPI0035CB7223